MRYWAIPGQEGYEHILGGLEKDGNTGAISTDPENHDKMCRLRALKVFKIPVPDLEVMGDADDADLLIVGFGGTFGHLYSAMTEMRNAGHKVALAHFSYINPLPKNTASVLTKYKKGGRSRAESRPVRRIPAHEDRRFRPLPVQPSERPALRSGRTRKGVH